MAHRFQGAKSFCYVFRGIVVFVGVGPDWVCRVCQRFPMREVAYKMEKREIHKLILFFAVFFIMMFSDIAGTIADHWLTFGYFESVLGVLAGPFAPNVTGVSIKDDSSTRVVQLLMSVALILSVALYGHSISRNRYCLCFGVIFLISLFCWLGRGLCYFAYWV